MLDNFTFVSVPPGLRMMVCVPSILMIHLQPSCFSLAAKNGNIRNVVKYTTLCNTSNIVTDERTTPDSYTDIFCIFRGLQLIIIIMEFIQFTSPTYHYVCLHPLAHK